MIRIGLTESVAASAFSPDGKRQEGMVGVDYGTKARADFKSKIGLIELY